MNHIAGLSFDKRILEHRNSSGVVGAVNRQCTYLVCNDGGLIGIAPSELGNGPRLILTDGYDLLRSSLSERATFALLRDRIDLPQWGQVDLSSASRWIPRQATGFESGWQSRLETAGTILNSYGNPAAQSMLRVPETELVEAVGRGNWAGAARAAEALVGLGPGLTPAGDDFLAGYFGTVHQLEPFLPIPSPQLLNLRKLVVDSLPGRTHPVSEAFTADFIEGYASDAFQEVLGAILCRAGEGTIWSACQRILDMGATTGTEILRGIVTSLEGVRQLFS